jgi:putative ABC transport system ATP-binding protein
METILRCENIDHHFGRENLRETVLKNVCLSLSFGQTALLMGPSGSGKTTLLSILGFLLKPCSGALWFREQEVSRASTTALARIRRNGIGFVFQHSRLLPFLNVTENLMAVGKNAGMHHNGVIHRIHEIAERLGFQGHLAKFPSELSGGQRQRVAIARAVLLRPAVILADEPTAALDWKHGQEAIQLLIDEAQQSGAAVMTVTHDARLIPYFGRILQMNEGRLEEKT